MAKTYKTYKIPYSIYKQYYNLCAAGDYDAAKKTIWVLLPEGFPGKFPSDWKRNGNHYEVPNGARVYVYNTGAARNYRIEFPDGRHQTICPGVFSMERVIEAANNG